MPIDWRLLNRDFGQQLGQALDPNTAAEKQNKLSDLAQGRQVRNMQIQSMIEDRKNKAISEQQRQSAMQGLSPEDLQQIRLGVPYKDILAQKQQTASLADLQRGLTGAPEARPLQGQVSGQFDISTPEKHAQLLKDMERLPPSEQAGMREALMQQGLIQPRTSEPTPEQRTAAIAQYAARGGRGANVVQQLYKPATEQQPSFAPIQGSDTYWVFDRRTGKYTRPEGAPVSPNANVQLQGQLAGAKAGGKEIGASQAKAKIELPGDIQEANNTITLIDDLLKHPGFDQAVGTSSVFGVQKIPGTEARAFMTRLDQLKGKQFMQAYQSLRGGGQITEVEGKKATDAMSRMDNSSTEAEFKTAAREFQDIIRQGVERAKQKASGQIAGSGQYDQDKEARYQAWKAQQGMK